MRPAQSDILARSVKDAGGGCHIAVCDGTLNIMTGNQSELIIHIPRGSFPRRCLLCQRNFLLNQRGLFRLRNFMLSHGNIVVRLLCLLNRSQNFGRVRDAGRTGRRILQRLSRKLIVGVFLESCVWCIARTSKMCVPEVPHCAWLELGPAWAPRPERSLDSRSKPQKPWGPKTKEWKLERTQRSRAIRKTSLRAYASSTPISAPPRMQERTEARSTNQCSIVLIVDENIS